MAGMFQTQIASESGFLSWLLQQIAAPIPLLVWAGLVTPSASPRASASIRARGWLSWYSC